MKYHFASVQLELKNNVLILSDLCCQWMSNIFLITAAASNNSPCSTNINVSTPLDTVPSIVTEATGSINKYILKFWALIKKNG